MMDQMDSVTLSYWIAWNNLEIEEQKEQERKSRRGTKRPGGGRSRRPLVNRPESDE